ncbi:MAG: HDOD domain-containing protein [Solirubrobacteraceae bacterium]
MPTTTAPISRPTDARVRRGSGHNEGQGRRLTAAFEALDAYPVLAQARVRVASLFDDGAPQVSDLVSAVEGDVSLTITVLRLANQVDGLTRGHVDNVVRAVGILTPMGVLAVANRARTYDFFERTEGWQTVPDRFRLHGVATQRAAARVAAEIDFEARDRLMVSALLHDVGKLVLMHAYPGYLRDIHEDARTPEERLQRERRELGVDHALVGGVIARRWGLPAQLAHALEAHHNSEADGEAAILRLADMLAHYTVGEPVSPPDLSRAARAVHLQPAQLREIMYEMPQSPAVGRSRQVDPCPLSARELDVLKRLAKGMVYKQIASELGLSTSTVRTHLHNVYGKSGAMDRAQAVLIATQRGWI